MRGVPTECLLSGTPANANRGKRRTRVEGVSGACRGRSMADACVCVCVCDKRIQDEDTVLQRSCIVVLLSFVMLPGVILGCLYQRRCLGGSLASRV